MNQGAQGAKRSPSRIVARTHVKWVAQVSLLETWVFRPGHIYGRNPGLRSETWATHSKSGGLILFESEPVCRDLRLVAGSYSL
jgi:hypothetical protein